ncbi:MAG: hypothetical protein ACN6PM_10245 [Achromobacter mucicolens]|jgi:hypothetical protein|uniref:hypothetical protein n=1 Tax=Achromobacter mucicolens TaxID=1389922 RepID=UPI003D0E562E
MHVFNRAIFACALLGAASSAWAAEIDKANCTYKGIPLYGKVKIVSSFPDIEVKVANAFPDLRVQKVSSFPDRCGRWQIVDNFPDFTVRLVDSFGDLSIKWVDHFPGVP